MLVSFYKDESASWPRHRPSCWVIDTVPDPALAIRCLCADAEEPVRKVEEG
jgi:hypothetical protein